MMVCPQVSYLAMMDSVDGDPCKFVLWSRGSAERFTLQASSTSIKMTWVENIAALLDAQNNFLSGELTSKKKLSHQLVNKMQILLESPDVQ